jgi:acyl carrier protein
MDNIEERVKNIVRGQLSYGTQSVEQIDNSAHLVHDLGFDSLDMVEAVMALEDEFGIEVSDEDGEKIMTVQQAIDYVRANVKA